MARLPSGVIGKKSKLTNERFRKKNRQDLSKNEHSEGAKYVEDGKYVEEDSGMNKVKVQSKF